MKKNQRHTTNEKPNIYKDIYDDNQYFGLSNRPSSVPVVLLDVACLFVDARAIILPMVINQLVWYLERMEDLQICIDIMNDLLTTLTKPAQLVVSLNLVFFHCAFNTTKFQHHEISPDGISTPPNFNTTKFHPTKFGAFFSTITTMKF